MAGVETSVIVWWERGTPCARGLGVGGVPA